MQHWSDIDDQLRQQIWVDSYCIVWGQVRNLVTSQIKAQACSSVAKLVRQFGPQGEEPQAVIWQQIEAQAKEDIDAG
jgi:hypothetical protein